MTNRYWYVLDGQANVVALTDVSGHVVDRYAYDLWGERLADGTSESVPQQLRYRGYWFDSELGWYWVSVRSYDPEGRWMQPDPAALDGVHTYVYADDDPVDLLKVGGAFGFGDFFHAALDFVQSVAHVVYKIAETAWNLVASDDIHTICCLRPSYWSWTTRPTPSPWTPAPPSSAPSTTSSRGII